MLSMEFLTQEQAIVIYRVTVPEGTTLDDVMQPTAWAHHTHLLRPDYEAVVKPADGAWRAHLEFRSVGKTAAAPTLLSFIEYDAAQDMMEESPYVAKYRGPSHRHCVVRRDSGAVEKTGFQTAEDARLWIANQAKAMAA